MKRAGFLTFAPERDDRKREMVEEAALYAASSIWISALECLRERIDKAEEKNRLIRARDVLLGWIASAIEPYAMSERSRQRASDEIRRLLESMRVAAGNSIRDVLEAGKGKFPDPGDPTLRGANAEWERISANFVRRINRLVKEIER